MTGLLLFTPFLIIPAILFSRSRKANVIVFILYSLMFLSESLYLFLKPESFTAYFSCDDTNTVFLLLLGFIQFAVALYSVKMLLDESLSLRWHKFYMVFYSLFTAAMAGVLLSTNLGLLWVLIEITTLMSTPLVYMEKTRAALEATWKYIFICSVGIAFSFVGVIFLSVGIGDIGSLFFADLYRNAKAISPFWLNLSFLFILFGFGTKAGLAPMHSWLPDAHSESPAPISALLSGMLLNTAFFGVLRVFKISLITGNSKVCQTLLLAAGFLSVFVAAVFILKIKNYKRMLAYSSIENMGIITLGFAVGGAGIFAGFYQMFCHSLIKTSFFLTSGNIYKLYKTKDAEKVSGLFSKDMMTAVLWLGCFLMITGVPPSGVFMAKFALVKAFFEAGHYLLAAGFLTLTVTVAYGMAKAVTRMCFSKDDTSPAAEQDRPGLLQYAPQIVLLAGAVLLGIYIPGFISGLWKIG